MKCYEKRDFDQNITESVAVWQSDDLTVSILSIKKYSNGFCEIKLYGRRNSFRRNSKEISVKEFQKRYVEAMQFIQCKVAQKLCVSVSAAVR